MKNCLALFVAACGLPLAAQNLSGLWDATVIYSGAEIPFRFEISANGGKASAAFVNGDERIPSTNGRAGNGALSLYFALYNGQLEAKLESGELVGTYTRPDRPVFPFRAKRFAPAPTPEGAIPSIAGLWEVAAKPAPWRLIARQSGAEVSASILRIDGDTGTLSGSFRNGKFVLGHFSGARPVRFEITVNTDGSLDVLQNGKTRLTALRSDAARAKGLPEMPDPSRYTSVKDPAEPFRFSGPDLKGQTVSQADPRFRGKVVVVSVGGSWCPNCHDEAPFLVELYRKYKSKGLEIVLLSFEEADQLKDPTRLRAFVKQYGVPFTVLLGGEMEQVQQRLPQAVNLTTWPATFFLGRDGKVRSVHAGFASKATGEEHTKLIGEVTHMVETLLAERVSLR